MDLIDVLEQLTTVRLEDLTVQARELLDFQQMNLFPMLDSLGAALRSAYAKR